MKILLIYQTEPDRPHVFNWSVLMSLPSKNHELRCAWWIVEQIDLDKIDPGLASGLMLTQDFQLFDPDIILFEGKPDPQNPPHGRSRKLPWILEKEFRSKGGTIVFLASFPDMNCPEENVGFIEYGFPLCISKNGNPVYLRGPSNDLMIRIQEWRIPPFMQNLTLGGIEILDEVIFKSSYVLDDRDGNFDLDEVLFYAPHHYDAKDPVWVRGEEIGGVRKPYAISAWKPYPAPVFLFTGDAFSDNMINNGDNAILLQILIECIETIQRKQGLLTSIRRDSETPVRAHMSVQKQGRSVFLSHSHLDKKFVKRLAEDLARRGIYVWVDEAEIKVGDSLIEKIREGIDKVGYLGVILSRTSVKSEWVKREVDIAMNQEISGRRVKVIPILIENLVQDEIPGFLVGKLYADFSSTDRYRDALRKLLERLKE
jgi:hypothetical protein